MTTHRAYIGLGANLGDRIATYERAVAALHELGTVVRRSAIYRTQPWGRSDQPWFVNGVVLLETELEPRALLDSLRAIETRLGRTKGERWGPRVIDLDLLLYDDREIDEPGLQLPHPYLRERAFVLVPLVELEESFAALRDALDASELAGVVRLT
ncbi:MAG: 2-amino-4-hydroxy-6-hydroxymethyldihydropteridine diphosphokinase [Candidatus Baltobacteraceae bacterium]